MNVKELYDNSNYLGGAKSALGDGHRVELKENSHGKLESHIFSEDKNTSGNSNTGLIVAVALVTVTITIAGVVIVSNISQKRKIRELEKLLIERNLENIDLNLIIEQLRDENSSLENELKSAFELETDEQEKIKSTIESNRKIINLSEKILPKMKQKAV